MLLILYGAGAQLGKNCRDYLIDKGYQLVDKYSYIEDGKPLHESRFGQRIYLSKEDFYAKTDSLFRYNVANVQVGFSWEHISGALYDNKKPSPLCVTMVFFLLESQFGCVLFPRRRRGNNTKEQPFCIISNTHQNRELLDNIRGTFCL